MYCYRTVLSDNASRRSPASSMTERFGHQLLLISGRRAVGLKSSVTPPAHSAPAYPTARRPACGCHVHTSQTCRNDERCTTPPTSRRPLAGPEGGGRRPRKSHVCDLRARYCRTRASPSSVAGGWGRQCTARRVSPHPDLATLGRPSPSGRDGAHLAVIRHLKCVNRTAARGPASAGGRGGRRAR